MSCVTFEIKLECLNCLNSTVFGTPSALKLFSIETPCSLLTLGANLQAASLLSPFS